MKSCTFFICLLFQSFIIAKPANECLLKVHVAKFGFNGIVTPIVYNANSLDRVEQASLENKQKGDVNVYEYVVQCDELYNVVLRDLCHPLSLKASVVLYDVSNINPKEDSIIVLFEDRLYKDVVDVKINLPVSKEEVFVHLEKITKGTVDPYFSLIRFGSGEFVYRFIDDYEYQITLYEVTDGQRIRYEKGPIARKKFKFFGVKNDDSHLNECEVLIDGADIIKSIEQE